MATIREYRKKIKSTKNIAKITKAMQMVAASKMRRSQDQAQKSRPYAEGLVNLTSLISTQADPSIHPLLLAKNEDSVKELVILVAPEKGLCGSLITNLAKSFYQSFLVNKMTQEPTQKILLPLHLTSEEKVNPENNLHPFYLFEPSDQDITDSLLV